MPPAERHRPRISFNPLYCPDPPSLAALRWLQSVHFRMVSSTDIPQTLRNASACKPQHGGASIMAPIRESSNSRLHRPRQAGRLSGQTLAKDPGFSRLSARRRRILECASKRGCIFSPDSGSGADHLQAAALWAPTSLATTPTKYAQSVFVSAVRRAAAFVAP